MKISLCMIARDEEVNLAQCLASAVHHVDEIIVVDTGSKDRTREVARNFGALVIDWNQQTHPSEFFVDDEASNRVFGGPPPYSGLVALANFAGARNAGFERATGDFVLWLDSDDVLEGGEHLRAVCQQMEVKSLDQVFLAYDYAQDHLGRTRYRQWRERIVRRGSATWVNPIHEVLLPAPGRGRNERVDQIIVRHRRKADRASIPNRNLKNLLREYARQQRQDGRVDPRVLFYLGQEYRFVDAQKALHFYERYVAVSGWGEERSHAHIAIASLYEAGCVAVPVEIAQQKAYDHFAVAAVEMPDSPDGLFGMARVAQIRGMHHDCIALTERGFAIGNTDTMLGTDPMQRLYYPHIALNFSLNALGRVEEAAASCRKGLEACPDDPGGGGVGPGVLTNNLKIYEAHLSQSPPRSQQTITLNDQEDLAKPPQAIPADSLAMFFIQTWKQIYYVDKRPDAATALLDLAPGVVRNHPAIARMRALGTQLQTATVPVDTARYGTFGKASPVRAESDGRKTLVLWIGQNIEDWDGETPNTVGIGGSETAAANMCRLLAARGWRVLVYGCPPTPRVVDGVEYLRWETFAGCDCDLFISSRDYAPVLREDVKAAVKLLWVHDIHVGEPSAAQERAFLRYDRILCLSEWHKSFFCNAYPVLHPDRVHVTRNGIDLSRFEGFSLAPRKNHLIWSSSPPRRLDVALNNLQWIRQQVPDAELHIYYGFETWEKFARARGNEAELAEIQRYRDLIAATPGAVYHGRVNQKQLAEAFLQAKVWGYLTDFQETSCVTAMEAQAAGAVPVASKLAALAETVKLPASLVELTEGHAKIWVDKVVRLLTDESYWCDQAQSCALLARHFSWDDVATEWERLFETITEQNKINPLHPWKRVA